jgi:hypothetical protein
MIYTTYDLTEGGCVALWPQLFLVKGDTINSAVDPILLLTSSKNPITINSFHGGRGAHSVGFKFSFLR